MQLTFVQPGVGTSFADKSPPDSHYMAQDQVKNILVIKIAWKLGMCKVF